MFVDTFIRRPILASVCSLVIIIAGSHRHPDPADRAVPAARGATGRGHDLLHRRQRAGGRVGGDDAARTGDQRRRGHVIHDLVERQRRHLPDHGDLRRDAEHRPRRRRRPESRLPGRGPAAERGQAGRHHRQQAGDRLRARRRRLREERRVRPALHQQLSRRLREGRAQAHPGSRRGVHLRRTQVLDAAVARPGPTGRPQPHGDGRRRRAPRAERPGRRRPGRTGARPRRTDVPNQRPCGWPAHGARGVREHHRACRRRRRAGAVEGRRPGRARRRELLDQPALQRSRLGRDWRRPAADGQRAGGVCGSHRRNAAAWHAVSARHGLRARLRHDHGRLGVDSRGADDAGRSDPARGAGDVPVPAGLAQHPHPGDHHSGRAHRDVCVRQAVRLLDQHVDTVRNHARHGSRRRRCDRGDREHPAPHARLRHIGAPGGVGSHGRSGGGGDCHGSGAGSGLRAGGAVPGNDRAGSISSSR